MPISVSRNLTVALSIQDEVVSFEFEQTKALNRDIDKLQTEGYKQSKRKGPLKRVTKKFEETFDAHCIKVTGYVDDNEQGEEVDLMTFQDWKARIPAHHKTGALAQLVNYETVDEDEASD